MVNLRPWKIVKQAVNTEQLALALNTKPAILNGMKKLLIILIIPLLCLGQDLTYVPDDAFEAYLELNNMGNGIDNDDYVTTSSINMVNYLDVNNKNISDLTGIEDFILIDTLKCDYNNLETLNLSNNLNLIWLGCAYNQLTSINVSNNYYLSSLGAENNNLTSIDVSNNPNLVNLICYSNQLNSADVRNGNNYNAEWYIFSDNPNLFCIDVDDPDYSTANWLVSFGMIDSTMSFSNNCSSLVEDINYNNKKLISITDVLGRNNNKGVQLQLYDDGTIEKTHLIK